ncbi:hypothetical protein SEUCBS140593_008269 [Sporothrix eucalyptigena]|uniref:Uncharacterized protein n=1 Tax=Sporothrix eucalyptigena TaxID=1812306 RepID=A0ABP0CKQ7_9PEZI
MSTEYDVCVMFNGGHNVLPHTHIGEGLGPISNNIYRMLEVHVVDVDALKKVILDEVVVKVIESKDDKDEVILDEIVLRL